MMLWFSLCLIYHLSIQFMQSSQPNCI